MTNIAKDISDRDDFHQTLDGLAREGARRLIMAAGGGTLGLFTAIARLRSVHARIVDALHDLGDGRPRHVVVADDRERRHVAAPDAGHALHAHAGMHGGIKRRGQRRRAGQLAAHRRADPHRQPRRRRVAVGEHVEVVIEARDLVHLDRRQPEFGGERDEEREALEEGLGHNCFGSYML